MSTFLKLPPRIKVLEALSAVVAGRVKVIDDKLCKVTSSDGSRVYTVYVDLSKGEVYSDDNGTRYRNYIGYPIIAFLMVKGVLPIDNELGKALADIPWRKLNEMYKKYETVLNIIYEKLEKEHNIPRSKAEHYMNIVLKELSKLKLRKLENPPLPS